MKKAERLNQELIFLRDKSRFQLKDLMKNFAISKRTALRDVEELGLMGLPVYTESGRAGGYRLLQQKLLVPVYFNGSEIQAIFFALHALDLLTDTPFERDYREIREKLLATLPESQQSDISKLLSVVHMVQAEPLAEKLPLSLILQAILEEKIIKLDYRQHGRQLLQVQMSELFYRDGIWFCSGFDVRAKTWGTYRCDKMAAVALCQPSKESLSLSELTVLQANYETHFHDVPFRVRLTDFGRELFLKHHYPNMRLEERNGISYIVGGYHASELDYMAHYLMSFGKQAVIEEPWELRAAYLGLLEEMKALNMK